jgi:hypothetical protein
MTPVLREFVIDGTRALAFSTGGGLDFAVLIDRSLDIGPLRWRDEPVGWVGPARFRHPAGHDPHADEGRGFNRLFSGFLVTGGLEHTRQPANGHPLHGSLPFTPGDLTGVGFHGADLLFCEGVVSQPGFRLRRRIEAPVRGNRFTIHDTVENLATAPQRQASLYHFNIGQPTLADGTVVKQGAERRLGPLRVPDATLASASVGYPVTDGQGTCTVETPRCTVTFAWDATTLPYLQLWHRLSADAPVLSIEPCTSERLPGGLSGEEPVLAPGGTRRYRLQVSFDG